MSTITKISSIILFLMALPIGLFYSPNLSIYVLGSIREGIVDGWLFANFSFVTGFGILVLLLLKDLVRNRPTVAMLVFLLAGIAMLHAIPSIVYWDYISAGQIIRDDTGSAAAVPMIWMFLWHLAIVGLAVFGLVTSVISRAGARSK